MQAIVRDSEVEQRAMSKSHEKLARIRRFLKCQRTESQLDEILELDGDINYQMPDSGDTALHLFAKKIGYLSYNNRCMKIAERLMDHGADPTVANWQGQNSVHLAAVDFEHPMTRAAKSPYIRHMLPVVHLRNGSTTNFKDIYGLSHFHVACMIDNMEIVEFFLNNGVSVNEAVNVDAPEFSGYTSLHFAVEFGSLDLVNKLLDRGANLLRDSRGMTPLHMLIRRNMEIVQHVSLYRIEVYDYSESGLVMNEEIALAEMEVKEKMIASIVSKRSKTAMVAVDLLPFYVMRTMKDGSLNWTRNDVNERIPVDSKLWPSYSTVHFAARFDIDTVKLLIEKGADIEVKDADGVTPFDLCVGRYGIEDIHSIISSHKVWRNILLSDSKTTLLDVVLAMRGSEELTKFLSQIQQSINDISIPRDSPLWPGFTMLHLAVTLSKKRMHESVGAGYRSIFEFELNSKIQSNELIEACLRLGADVLAQDRSGYTPIHLAFRRMDLDSMYVLQERYDGKSNATDEDNLSLLHIACVLENENLVKQLLDSGADVNAAVSSTFQWDPEVRYFYELTSSDEHLHVWPGSTPLHIVVMMRNKAIFKLLLEAGANPNARDIHGVTPVHRLLAVSMSYELTAEYDDLLSRFVLRDCVVDGLSYLHVAAHHAYPKLLEKLVNLGADANSAVVARERVTSKLPHSSVTCRRKTKFSYYLTYFEGDTPLHIAIHYDSRQGDIPQTLVSGGADILAENSKDISPICKIFRYRSLLRHYLSVMSVDEEKRLFDKMGITRLHMACQLRDEEMVRDCLKKGADVNSRVRDDSEIWPGSTPLHVLAEGHCYTEYTAHGFTVEIHPLTFTKKTLCRTVRMLLKAGADVMIVDAKGQTPLMVNIHEMDIREREAHIDILWTKLKNIDVNPVNHQGISLFHLACFRNDVDLVERFLKLGVDPNQTVDYLSKDYPGYTPLHFAVRLKRINVFLNELPSLRTVNLLIKYGANINARDINNDTPLHLAGESCFLSALSYKRLFWAGADIEAENLDNRVPENRMFGVERGDLREFFNYVISHCSDNLRDQFSPCIRCYYRVNRRVQEIYNIVKRKMNHETSIS